MKEVWRDVIGYEGLYEVSNKARVRRGCIGSRIRKPGSILTARVNHYGYKVVDLWRAGKCKRKYVHWLLMAAWVGPREGRDTRHLDGNKLNNSLRNLRYGTRSENMRDAYRHDPMRKGFRTPWILQKAIRARIPVTARGSGHGQAKLTEDMVREIRSAQRVPLKILAAQYKITAQHVWKIRAKKGWTHVI